MRIIDADALLERFNLIYPHIEVKRIIDGQPTVYDVDKVMEELKSKRDYYYHEMKKAENDINYFSGHYFDESYNKRIALNEAIEIVKRGGISETN